MKRVTTTTILAIAISCVALLAVGVGSADASPETDGLRGVSAAISPDLGSMARFVGGRRSPTSLTTVLANEGTPDVSTARAAARSTRPTSATTTEADAPASAPTPLGGPHSPTPFGLSLVGLISLGIAMHRRSRRMSAPLL